MQISLGRDSSTGNEFSIDSKHINIEGMSGMGKSTLLVNLFIEHIRQGNRGLFIDPHGDTADQIARLITFNNLGSATTTNPTIAIDQDGGATSTSNGGTSARAKAAGGSLRRSILTAFTATVRSRFNLRPPRSSIRLTARPTTP